MKENFLHLNIFIKFINNKICLCKCFFKTHKNINIFFCKRICKYNIYTKKECFIDFFSLAFSSFFFVFQFLFFSRVRIKIFTDK